MMNVGSGARTAADGVFFVDPGMRFGDRGDGLSNTALLSESLLGPGRTDITSAAVMRAELHYGEYSSGPQTPAM